MVFDFQGETKAVLQAVSNSSPLQRWQYKSHDTILQVGKWSTERLMAALVLPKEPSDFQCMNSIYTISSKACGALWGKERAK